MDNRLQRLQRLTNAMQARKRAYEFRLGQINHRMTTLAGEREALLQTANGAELFPGSNIHYVKRLEGIDRQMQAQQKELEQLKLLQMKAGADLRRSEISLNMEFAAVEKLKEARYLEQVIDTALVSRRD